MTKRKIKVMTLIDTMDNGGAQRVVLNYLRDFKDDNDIEFKVFTYEGDTNSYCNKIIRNEKLNVTYLKKPHTKINIPYIKRWFNLKIAKKKWNMAIKKFDPDIAHVHISPFLNMTLEAIVKNNVPVRFDTLHSNPLRFRGQILKKIRKAFQKENFVPVCITKEQALVAKKYYNFNNYEIVYNGIDINDIKSKIIKKTEARKKYNLSPQTYIVIGVGRLEKIKRFDILIEAFANLHKVKKDSILIFAGEGPERNKLENLTKKLDIEDCVRFLGYQSNIIPLYCAADVLAMTSTSEASPLVLLESQICGLRTIISAGVPSESIVTTIVKKMAKGATIEDWCNALLDVNFVGKKENDISNYEISSASQRMKDVYIKYWNQYRKEMNDIDK